MQNTRVLVLLGARMARTRGPDCWRFPLFLEETTDAKGYLPGEVSGGSSRMRAVQAIYQESVALGNDGLSILVTGGKERDGSSRADEAARQLVLRYGLPQDAVRSIRGGGSTIGNAEATAEYIKCNPHMMVDSRPIEIVTNDYHMLRAWIVFSKQMLEMAGGPKLSVSLTEQERIRQIFMGELSERSDWRPSRLTEDRQEVMRLLRPHFSGTQDIAPLVVEDILEHRPGCRQSGQRYTRRLRNNVWVRRTLRLEYERIMNLLGYELAANV